MDTVGVTGGRGDDCDCWDADAALPCWPCYRDGFDVPNPSAGEEISYKAHIALDYGGMHPNPEEHL